MPKTQLFYFLNTSEQHLGCDGYLKSACDSDESAQLLVLSGECVTSTAVQHSTGVRVYLCQACQGNGHVVDMDKRSAESRPAPQPTQGLGPRSGYFRKMRPPSCEKYLVLSMAFTPLTRLGLLQGSCKPDMNVCSLKAHCDPTSKAHLSLPCACHRIRLPSGTSFAGGGPFHRFGSQHRRREW